MPDGAAGSITDQTDALFDAAVAFVVDDLEGGSKLVEDSGGLTKYGISQRAYPDLDIRSLDRAKALRLYHRDYWLPSRAYTLPPPLALAVFDAAVNLGPPQAVVLLQRVLGVQDDGIIGPLTLKAVSKATVAELLSSYLEIRARFYQELADSKPVYRPYLRGWRHRCFRVAVEAGRWTA